MQFNSLKPDGKINGNSNEEIIINIMDNLSILKELRLSFSKNNNKNIKTYTKTSTRKCIQSGSGKKLAADLKIIRKIIMINVQLLFSLDIPSLSLKVFSNIHIPT
jgi:hypothetical protein